MELASGEVVHGWRVEAMVGRGAMAVVYRVRHETLGTEAALKLLDRVDPALERRLVAEGRAQGSLGHPGIVRVLDLVRVRDHAALVLEYVPGDDLAVRLRRGPLPLDAALAVFRQVVDAVGAAHAAGLVHRDLKPSNVLVVDTAAGPVAKVGDFGLVKTGHGDLTLTHALVGTPRYMAPEQMRAAHRVDARADVFALGCLLYELVAGRPPFDDVDLVALYGAKMGGRYARLAAPPAVGAAIDGCLQGALAQRIPDCATLLRVLDGEPFHPPADATFDGGPSVAVCPSCGAAGAADPCATCGTPMALDGRFRLVTLVASGRGTRVWRAVDLRDGGWVCVRALAASAGPEARARFDRGANTLGQLDHPQIARAVCPPFDEHGSRWEVRAWVEGVTLAERIAGGRMTEDEVVGVVRGLVPPLAYLARCRPPVVHRAVAPEHVVQTPDGQLVLIDFAQVRDAGPDGSLLDEPAAAPEVWVGEASPATDVYGLGSLAVSLLGRAPAHTRTDRGRIRVRGAVTARPDTLALLERMVDPDPARRPSIDAVGRALVVRPPGQRWLPLWLGVAVSMIVMGWVVVAVSAMLVPTLLLYDESTRPRILAPVSSPAPSPALDPRALPARGAGRDLADRAVPTPDCGRPLTQRVRVVGPAGGVPVPLSLTSDCGSVSLGTWPAGREVSLELPYPGSIRIPRGEPQCGLADDPRIPCAGYVLGERTADGVVVIDVGSPTEQRVSDPEGNAVSGILTIGDDGGVASDPLRVPIVDGVAKWPWEVALAKEFVLEENRLVARDVAVLVDGVGRRVTYRGSDLVVEPLLREVQIAVVDPVGAPVSDVLVLCAGLTRTSADGVARCDGGSRSGAEVRAPGFADGYTPFADPVVQVVLQPASTLRVGCAGMPDDRCPTSDAYACFAGDERSGSCSSDGTGLVCRCSADTTLVAHPVFGRADRPDDLPSVWFDLRGISGSVSGPPDCSLALFGAGVWTEAPGPTMTRVPPGAYTATGSCPGDQSYSQPVQVEDREVIVRPERRRTPRILVPPVELEAETSVERELLEYTFPAPPEGETAKGGCEVRATISADGHLARVEPRRCSARGFEVVRSVLASWRWAPGPAETSETLNVPFH